MNDKRQDDRPSGSMTVGDILYVIFRHKWKIILISLAGIVATALLPFVKPIPYRSEASLLIKYVLERTIPGLPTTANEATFQSVAAEERVLNTELEILTSLDLARQVATNIGPEKVLAKAGGGNDPSAAAFLIKKNLEASVLKQGNVIRIVFQHPSGEIAQSVLQQVLQAYQHKHREMHGDVSNFDEVLKSQTEDYRRRLENTEEELKKARAEAGIIATLEDSKKYYTEVVSKLRQQVDGAKVELAKHKATVEKLEQLLNASSVVATNPVIATNRAAVPLEKLTSYRKVRLLLESLEKQQELLIKDGFTPESSRVKSVQEQITTNEKLKKQLEDEYPGLLAVKVTEPKSTASDSTSKIRTDLITEMATVSALESSIEALTDQLAVARRDAARLSNVEGKIAELERRRDMEAQQYKIDTEHLEKSRVVAISAGKQWNIGEIQAPSPAVPAASKLYKLMAMLLVGSIGAAFGLAFLIEFYLDRSLKRPVDIEAGLGLPLFISIPRMKLNNGKPGDSKAERNTPLLAQYASESEESEGEVTDASSSAAVPHAAALAPWGTKQELRPFSEALRDRLITYFEINNVTRKPKLVAITSCAEGSGVSTVAAGLAASLSETGDGKVLLVDMNGKNGDTHQFFKGRLAVLEDAIEIETRDNARVQDNLYVATEPVTNDNLPRVLPKRFKNLVGRLHASDFDYIIFDMPQVSQVSVTPRLARFMDMVLLVVESEKADRDVVKRASSMLSESKANVSVVLNKEQAHVPKWLKQGH